MGGLGSGRQSGSGRTTVESCRAIDANRLRKEGVIGAGWLGSWSWTRNGETVATIGIRGGQDRITLTYRWKQSGRDWEDIVEPIDLKWRACRYGGERPFFECPGLVNGVACRRLVVKLFGTGRYFLCRHCYRLTYASRNEDMCDRALRRANRHRLRLGGAPGFEAVIPRRPKGMWRKTYDRLFEAIIENESRAEERLTRMAALLLDLDQRLETNKRKPKRGYW